MQLMYVIDDHRRLPTMPAAEAPIDAKSGAEALYHPDKYDTNLRRDIRGTGMDGRWSMGSDVVIWRTG